MSGDDITPARAKAQRERLPRPFPVCPPWRAGQIRGVRRFRALVVSAFAALPAVLGAGDVPARFDVVATKPASASIIIGTVTLAISPFIRKDGVYAATYLARVFPFFYSEKGRIVIAIPDNDLRRVARGEAAGFKGRATTDSGDVRRIEGSAMPTGPLAGKLRVKVFITRHIALTYNTTYELQGVETPLAAATAR